MKKKEEEFEKIPEFFSPAKAIVAEVVPTKEEVIEEEDDEPILDSFKEEKLRALVDKVSNIKVEQSSNIVEFETYKANLTPLFKEVSWLYQSLNEWDFESFLDLYGYLFDHDITDFINKIAYIPNNKYLPNIIELMALEVESGNFDIGSILDTETTFQSFKRIYTERVQLILMPFLIYTHSLCKKLIPVKRTLLNIFNKTGKIYESFYLMNELQKSMIRMKKCQELLMQEGYSLEEKVNENIDLLITLAGTNHVLYPMYNAYKEVAENSAIDLEKNLLAHYEISPNTIVKPLPQVLLTYKQHELGVKTTNTLYSWQGSLNSAFEQYLVDFLKEEFLNITLDRNLTTSMREIVFGIMEAAKRKNWNTIEIIKSAFIAIFNANPRLTRNTIKVLAYTFAREIMASVLKIKYKPEDGVQGLAKAFIYFETSSKNFENYEFLKNKINKKIISEFLYNGMLDTSLEIYPNFITLEKYSELFVNTAKTEKENLKISLQKEEMRKFLVV